MAATAQNAGFRRFVMHRSRSFNRIRYRILDLAGLALAAVIMLPNKASGQDYLGELLTRGWEASSSDDTTDSEDSGFSRGGRHGGGGHSGGFKGGHSGGFKGGHGLKHAAGAASSVHRHAGVHKSDGGGKGHAHHSTHGGSHRNGSHGDASFHNQISQQLKDSGALFGHGHPNNSFRRLDAPIGPGLRDPTKELNHVEESTLSFRESLSQPFGGTQSVPSSDREAELRNRISERLNQANGDTPNIVSPQFDPRAEVERNMTPEEIAESRKRALNRKLTIEMIERHRKAERDKTLRQKVEEELEMLNRLYEGMRDTIENFNKSYDINTGVRG
jgi:hypothetical protein